MVLLTAKQYKVEMGQIFTINLILHTRENFFAQSRKNFHIHNGSDNSFQHSKFRVDANSDQHEKKHDGPESWKREFVDCFSED